jgi:hypothetical protein
MISAGAIYGKTAAGAQEVKNRKMKLAPRLRTMLILVDGAKPLLILREEGEALGVPTDFIEQLEELGLVNLIGTAGTSPAVPAAGGAGPADGARMEPVARFRMAQQFMNDTAVNVLCIKAFFFTLKLEKCATVDDLGELVEAYRAAITKASGPEEADVLTRRLQEILGP